MVFKPANHYLTGLKSITDGNEVVPVPVLKFPFGTNEFRRTAVQRQGCVAFTCNSSQRGWTTLRCFTIPTSEKPFRSP